MLGAASLKFHLSDFIAIGRNRDDVTNVPEYLSSVYVYRGKRK